MSRFILVIVISCLFYNLPSTAQTFWDYDFGTGTGTYNTPGLSNTFLPTPPTNGGTAYVILGSGGGEFSLVNPGILGSGSELQATAGSDSLDGLINKFTIYNLSGDKTFSVKFSVRFEGGTNGSCWYFFLGNGDYFSNTKRYQNTMIFGGLKWQFTGTSDINSYILPKNNSWGKKQDWGLTKDVKYVFEIWANNTSSIQSYNYSVNKVLPVRSYDVWLNGVYLTNQVTTGLLLNNDVSITGFCFLGEFSTDNTAKIIIDDITYFNYLQNGPLPVELSSFSASIVKEGIKLNWVTETEVNNYGLPQ